MPKTQTFDGLQLRKLAIVANPQTKAFDLYAEFDLRSGNQVVQTKFGQLTAQQVTARQSAVAALMASLGQELAAVELA